MEGGGAALWQHIRRQLMQVSLYTMHSVQDLMEQVRLPPHKADAQLCPCPPRGI
jgi:hypothetical protein